MSGNVWLKRFASERRSVILDVAIQSGINKGSHLGTPCPGEGPYHKDRPAIGDYSVVGTCTRQVE
jgi:hypothetical protein